MFPNPTEPLVVRTLRAHRLDIMAREAGVMQSLAQAWLDVENSLRAEMQILAMEAQAVGKVSAVRLAKMERYGRLLAQAEARHQVFVDAASVTIGDYQTELARRGLDHAVEATRAVYIGGGQIGPVFDILPVDAIESLIGVTADGTPLNVYLQERYPQAVNGVTRALIDGVAMGIEPIEIAKNMMDAFGVSYKTAINMARTEPLRVYRASSQMQYEASGVVRGWKRLSAHDSRVCAGCLFTEGEFYDNLHEFEEHNQGRCTPVPVVIGVNEPSWVSGGDWFVLQDEETQRSILGDGRYQAWQDGTSLDAMVKRVSDPVWGGSFIPTPLSEIIN
ncbi:MAG: hypothetical protein DRI32_00430 [Chloroflexi bacterium]|nr:MAG: hypothetical protein DRI32_00430 [Chloroflexota bacterium]